MYIRGLRAALTAPCHCSKTVPESPRLVLQPRGLQHGSLGLSSALRSLGLFTLLSPGELPRTLGLTNWSAWTWKRIGSSGAGKCLYSQSEVAVVLRLIQRHFQRIIYIIVKFCTLRTIKGQRRVTPKCLFLVNIKNLSGPLFVHFTWLNDCEKCGQITDEDLSEIQRFIIVRLMLLL